VIATLEAPIILAGKQVFVRASVGVAVDGGGLGMTELLRNADIAMYTAKGRGKSTYELFQPWMLTSALDRHDLVLALQEAVHRQEFEVHYQPVVALGSGRITGAEALVRWRRPGHGLVPPDQFIPVAEETGLVVDIDRLVLAAACRQAAAWAAAQPDGRFDLHVNVSARHLQQANLVADVAGALDASGLDPSCLTIEITERTLMRQTDVVLEHLHDLKRLGVRLAVDDFGVGYSSLAYLQQMPVDVIKVDRSFVAHLDTGHDATLARAIVNLARTLDLEVVAEGVEHRAQVEQLVAFGCGLGQGFHFSRPVEPGALAAQLGQAPSAALSGATGR
jgi:EAL domain-containing protein (putative c-di-GMP-specific phosphodiesterase class I)